MLIAADLRTVAADARRLCGLLKRGIHPSGGQFVIPSRLIGRGAAAAMALLGEEINGPQAVELGLAWELVVDATVEDHALERATRVWSALSWHGRWGGNFRRGGVIGAVACGVAFSTSDLLE